MRSWISASDHHRSRPGPARRRRRRALPRDLRRGGPRRRRTAALAGSFILATVLGATLAPAATSWTWSPELTLGAGHEDDLILDPDSLGAVVPGGAFLDLTPAVTGETRLGERSRLRLDARGQLERYLNERDRLLSALSVQGDLFLAPRGPLDLRLGAGGGWFRDSERDLAERLDAGLEGAVGGGGRDWRLEALVGLGGRRYPELTVLDDRGRPATYVESGLEAGGAVFLRPSPELWLQARLTRQRTDATDPLFDADAWVWRTAARWQAAPADRLVLFATGQERTFDERVAPFASDSYLQLGAAIEHELAAGATLVGRYAFSRYEGTLGEAVDSHRLSLAVAIGTGRRPTRTSTPSLEDLLQQRPLPRADEPLRFRLRAPGAERVSVVGDFNGWDPAAAPLSRAGDGWWETSLRLPAGVHEYAYLVDGRPVTPPEAEATVPDGFGGRNALLRVQPAR